MDTASLYGPVFHKLGFGHAVEAGVLSDYNGMESFTDDAVKDQTLAETGIRPASRSRRFRRRRTT